ncbi:FAR1 DNA binding domain, Zinc finger, SWIM-type, MULE transposase domain, FHY3/FAR1 family [Artemisia annua]|uniref:FAR1 DNA binding domain, Zinc finger, SWIM-type, MULE transposase domain, FHY3/FAR1 family n=1 Tax=Artemisia annua TaxID=35608 RepID=A0A2U1P541_ARTAN|nr:FAR1 DNA binding domain, Zinc finger, SWIM-type, MULE transposase domain, FHY3/FAR1 family [Artemisia annua]
MLVYEPSTPRSTDHNVQDNVVDAESVPQAGSYQPTPPGSKFWIPEAKKKPVEGTEFDTIEQAFTFYKEYAREGGFEVRRGGQSNRKKKQNPDLKYFCCSKEGVKQPKKDKPKPDTSSSDITEVVKVGPDLCSKDDFKQRLCDIVWTDKINPDVFESEWESIMNDFSLNDKKWLNDMFEMRTKRIPAYFRHEPMSGLMRTTSSVQESDSCSTFVIRDTEADYRIKGSWVQAKYEVTYVPDPCSAKCTCLRYECYGLLCRHIFYVLRMSRVFHFPKQYMDNRWSKHAMTHRFVDANKASPSSTKSDSVVDATVREIYSNVEESLHHLVDDIQKLHIYRDDQTALMEKTKLDVPNPPKLNTNEAYARTLGVTEPTELTIFTPTGINNKGQVIRTRRKSKSEIAIELGDKPMRMCKTCNKLARHDSRNCPTKKNKGLQDEDVDQYMDDSD